MPPPTMPPPAQPLAAQTALVVIDVQGNLARIVHDSETLLKNAAILAQGMAVLDVPIVTTEQYPKGLGPTVPELAAHIGPAPVIEKSTFSCCGCEPFDQRLRELHRGDIALCGIEAHVCVYQTARDLLRQGFRVHLVTDAISSRREANTRLAIEKLQGMGALLTSTEMLLFELLRASGTPQFKAISRLVR
jgi:nicotinamidase-related amidase